METIVNELREIPLLHTEMSVLAVVLGVSQGRHLPECSAALRRQTHGDVTVVYLAEAAALRLPGAEELRGSTIVVPSIASLGAAANALVEQSDHFDVIVFVRDDVALERDAIERACEAMSTTLAAVVGGKVYSSGASDVSDVLLEVGMSADRQASPYSPLDGAEIDQSQYDAMRQTLFVSFSCMAVQTSALAAVGGFDGEMTGPLADLDLCWRIRLAGEDVVYAPDVRARRLGPEAVNPGDEAQLRRNKVRLVLKNYGPGRAFVFGAAGFLYAVAQMIAGIMTGHGRRSREPVEPYTWNLSRPGELLQERHATQRLRTVGDRQITKFMIGGSARLLSGSDAKARAAAGDGETAPDVQRRLAGYYEAMGGRWMLAVAGLLLLVLLVGRAFVGAPLPSVGRLAPATGSAFHSVTAMFASWRGADLGSPAPVPPAVGLTGLVGLLTLGSVGLAQKLLLYLALPLAAVSCSRSLRPLLQSRPARVAAAAVYVLAPLWWNALAHGETGVLVLAILLPPIARRLAHLTGLPGYEDGAPPLRRTLELALLLAVAMAAEPAAVWPVVALVAGWTAASVLAGGLRGALAAAGRCLLALAVGAVLLAPWSLSLFGGDAALRAFAANGAHPPLLALLRFDTGRFGAGVLPYGLLPAALVPLLVARGPRFAWAARFWGGALAGWALACLVARGVLPGLGLLDVLLGGAMLSIACLVGVGVEAIVHDLPEVRFGVRQPLSFVLVALAVLGVLAPFTALPDGRLGASQADWRASLVWQSDEARGGPFLDLFLGSDVPGDARPLGNGLEFGVTGPGGPLQHDLWLPPTTPGMAKLRDVVRTVSEGGAPNAGALLSTFGVRYVAVPHGDKATVRTLGAALDLGLFYTDDSGTVFENKAWTPPVVGVRSPVPAAGRSPVELATMPPLQPVGVWRSSGEATWRGPAGASVFAAVAYDQGFRLDSGGRELAPRPALGWAMQFTGAPSGRGVIARRQTPWRFLAILLAAAGWLVLLGGAVGMRATTRPRGRR